MSAAAAIPKKTSHFSISSGAGYPIANTVPWSAIDGIIWGKPKLVSGPNTTLFTVIQPAAVADFGSLYAMASGSMTGVTPTPAPTDYSYGWSATAIKSAVDIMFHQWLGQFSGTPKNIAIVLNFDDVLNAGGPYYYDFATDDYTVTSPTQLISEGNGSHSLAWIAEDYAAGFPAGTVTQDGVTRRKTLIFVCPVASNGPNYVSFSFAYLESKMGSSNVGNAKNFDPKIRNDG
jgi:hypothetical protein